MLGVVVGDVLDLQRQRGRPHRLVYGRPAPGRCRQVHQEAHGASRSSRNWASRSGSGAGRVGHRHLRTEIGQPGIILGQDAAHPLQKWPLAPGQVRHQHTRAPGLGRRLPIERFVRQARQRLRHPLRRGVQGLEHHHMLRGRLSRVEHCLSDICHKPLEK